MADIGRSTHAGRRLLERLARFGPEPVPEFLLEVPIKPLASARSALQNYLGKFAPKLTNLLADDKLADALANLVDYSLARRDPDKQEFSIHRLLQDATRQGLVEAKGHVRSAIDAAKWIDAAALKARDAYAAFSLLPHLAAVLTI
jgi:hypothetical protein